MNVLLAVIYGWGNLAKESLQGQWREVNMSRSSGGDSCGDKMGVAAKVIRLSMQN